MEKTICVWLDSTSDLEDPAWIVSEDELDEQGDSTRCNTLYVRHQYEDALVIAKREAKGRNLPLVVLDGIFKDRIEVK